MYDSAKTASLIVDIQHTFHFNFDLVAKSQKVTKNIFLRTLRMMVSPKRAPVSIGRWW
jgi:hypothetical protein